MIGTQTNTYWVYKDGKPALEYGPQSRTERFIKIKMPWRREMYSILTDELVNVRPVFSLYWYRPAPDALVIRFGWSSS